MNKKIWVENLAEETVIGHRINLKYIRTNNYNPHTVSLIRQLLVNVGKSYCVEELKNKTSQQLCNINDKILTLNQKEKSIRENDSWTQKDSSNEMAFETEKQPKLVLLSQSNALKWAATEKQVKLDAYLKGEETYWKKKTVMIHL